MRILVTGGGGQVARSIAERARFAQSVEVISADRSFLDITDVPSIAPVMDRIAPNIVINAAAYTAVDKAETDPHAFAVNADGAGALASAAEAAGARLLHLSTDYVFDGSGQAPRDESAPTGPINAYGRSKLAGEVAVRSEKPDATIIRTSWLFSPFGTNFVRSMVAAATQRPVLEVVADQVGNPTSGLDLADALLAIARSWREGNVMGRGETYHIAGTGFASWADVAEAVMEECAAQGRPAARIERIRSADWPTAARRPLNSQLDCGKAAADFGIVMPDWQSSLGPIVARIEAPE